MAGRVRRRHYVSGIGWWWLVSGAMIMCGHGEPAAAQSSVLPDPVQDAVRQRVFLFDIAAKPLPQAITDLSLLTGTQVLYTEILPFQHQAPALKGRYSVEEALSKLLRGTGLSFRFTSAGAVTLLQTPAGKAGSPDGAISLPAMHVEGAHAADPQRPYGPGAGYIASRSTAATKTDTPLLETPQTVSEVTREEINDFGAQSIAEALNYTAGVQNQPYGYDPRYDQLLIRGFSASQYGNYRDGLRQGNGSFAYFRNDPYELDRIEVFQGPTSVLYGSNDPGGLVNNVSKLPTAAPLHEVELTLGNYARYQGRVDLSGPLTSNNSVLYRLTGIARDSDTQVPSTKNNRLALAPSVTIRLGSNTTLTLMAEYQKNQTSMWPYYLYIPGQGLSHVRLGDPAFDAMNQEQWSLGYRLEHHAGNMITLRQNFRFGRAYFYGGFVDEDTLSGTTLNRYSGLWRERLATINLDNQAQLRFRTGRLDHTVLAGIDYFWQSLDSTMGLGTAPSIDILNPVYGTGPISILSSTYSVHQNLDQLGLYAQEQLAYGRWHFVLGGREDIVSTGTSNHISNQSTSDNPSAFTWRAGIVYTSPSGISPYFSYSTSFLPTAGTGSPANGSRQFKPTTGRQYEAGIKYQPPGLDSFFTLAAYDLVQQNVLTTDPQNTLYSIQTGEVRSRGFQAQAVASLGSGFNGIFAYSYADVLNTRSTTAFDKVPVGVPRNQASLFLNYSTARSRIGGFGLGGGVRYIGTTWADTQNTQKNTDILSFDMLAHKDFDRFRLQLNINNLLDRRVAVCNSGNCTWSMGRTILGTVRVRW